jgi:twitching motility protein PilT
MADLDRILRFAVGENASDIHLKVDSPPMLRRYGTLAVEPSLPVLSAADLRSIVEQMADPPQIERLDRQRQVDLGYGTPDLGRFRVNVYHQRGELRIAFRWIPTRIRSLADLGMPASVSTVATGSRGLILVTGTTGSGKSTTLAAMIDLLNKTEADHIITIEDPIEYVHVDQKSLVSQREVGVDVVSFADGLRGALRQDPGTILIGEMRDLETIESAILAAETGHLVMSTLHTLDAPETVTRIIQAFPDHQRDQIRVVLSSVLKGIVSQRLVPKADGKGMVPAVEVLVSTALVRSIIKDPKRSPSELTDALAKGHVTYGTQTFDQSLMHLFKSDQITYEEAMRQATNPDDFALMVRGISSTSDARWNEFDRAQGGEAGGETGAVPSPSPGGSPSPTPSPGLRPPAPAAPRVPPGNVRRF